MASLRMGQGSWLLAFCLVFFLLPGRVAAFGAGNIPSVAQVEGHNWRHGDIEDMLKTIAFLHGKKWTSMLVKRTYFGNWLRDYSQAVDVGSLKGPVNAATIRILIWVLSFMAFGYATEEFEVTEERLGVYRPEEHIDNPLGYADGIDARKYHPKLRGPVHPVETEIDPRTGMKNYIANESGGWTTSTGYLRYSFERSIHFGRVYTSGGHGKRGRDADLHEALRCLGQALHCMEDFSAHSNYCELALREMGYHDVFPHCGAATEINLHGKRVFPLVTGTFGAVDFLHSVIGEATDHFTQSEVDEVDVVLKNSEGGSSSSSGTRGFGLTAGQDFISLVGNLPGVGGGFASQARALKEASDAQERENQRSGMMEGTRATSNENVVPGMSPNFDPVKVAKQIYPILEFRDKIVRNISAGISMVPGLEKLLDHISETLTAFILGLLAPFVRPIITQVSKVLKDGSSSVISASAHSQLEPWTNSHCSDPTHSMLSKDHFTNALNSCAGRVASTILQYVVPRILYAWENPGVPVHEVVSDILRAFHHPAIRDERIEIQRDMFNTVRRWVDEHPRRHEISHILSSESVRNGKNHMLQSHKGQGGGGHSHGSPWDMLGELGHGKVAGGLWGQIKTRDASALRGGDGNPSRGYLSASPLSSPSFAPPQLNYGYGAGESHLRPGSSGGYSAPSPQPYQGYYQPPPGPPPPQGYQPPASQGYYQPPQQQPPPQQYPGQGYGQSSYQQGYQQPPPSQPPYPPYPPY